jgi:hypothetical protein
VSLSQIRFVIFSWIGCSGDGRALHARGDLSSGARLSRRSLCLTAVLTSGARSSTVVVEARPGEGLWRSQLPERSWAGLHPAIAVEPLHLRCDSLRQSHHSPSYNWASAAGPNGGIVSVAQLLDKPVMVIAAASRGWQRQRPEEA